MENLTKEQEDFNRVMDDYGKAMKEYHEGTTSYKTGAFDHTKFWDWCRKMSENNSVFVSEYKAPDDFICVWEGEVKTNFASQRDKATHKAAEKLFKFSPTNVQY